MLAGTLLLLPSLLLLLALFIFPLAVVLSRSVSDPSFGLQNYAALGRSPAFRNILVNTFEIAACTTAIRLLIGYPFSHYHLSRLPKRWGQSVSRPLPRFRSSLRFPPGPYAWTLDPRRRRSVINTYLAALGRHPTPGRACWMNRPGVIIGMVHVKPSQHDHCALLGRWSGIDRSLIDAATSLGRQSICGIPPGLSCR